MVSFRWTRHRVVDASGNDKKGHAAISMWWVARAAAEETLQGSPFVSAWLKLLDTLCHNELLRSMGYPKDEYIPVKPLQRFFSPFFDMDADAL